ncbi:MAG TPA: family 43 glycosylhydrolase [Anaerohalosphaeraceae bacterium]|nr:family 43 glycosylhydrolase [Phycisphaerae bacterium]HOL32185.1 family 43 glycosylhydrolase [Anaerohalosphaeraceae bacterium]HPC64202.1 family 43 glycosylhydrolase [Anaerohalosphaeraceae bacterium]HPO68830.1 family 43 glycosylhydrolase [Anaerohalosphaeraceae bacterium]HRS70954.1 family 43 glycosylhydrolase [Anaerohalosphaeraceae bacterium]
MKQYVTIITLGIVLWAAPLLEAMDNPFSYEDGINDCDVIKYNGEYYITGNWLGGDMFRSRNLTDWGERIHIFSWNNTWHVQRNANRDMDIHGTHIAYDNGQFHLYAHLDTPAGNLLGIVHAVSNQVTGPYTEPVDAPFATDTIDVKTFRDEDGSLHFYSTRFGGVSANHNDYRSMQDYSTFTSGYKTLIWPTGGWEIHPELPEFSYGPTINEGPFVFKYRGKYYMLYNANHTGDTSYAIGCAMADTASSFSNAGKLPSPVLGKTLYTIGSSSFTIYTLGQPWVVDGLNGFEKWIGYFAIDENERYEGRTQRIDRIHFLDRTLYIDGPTNRYTPGYHPGPAEPQLRSLFYLPDGPMPSTDWIQTSPNNNPGLWQISSGQALQSSQSCFSFNLVNRDAATCYLFEANVTMPQPRDSEDKAGVVAYYKNSTNWVIIGLDRSLGYGADNWYCHIRTDAYNGVVAAGGFGGRLNYGVYHKIRVERNSTLFRVWIDDMLPPGFSNIQTSITDAGVPGLYSDHAAALFDGIIYTIGWDEYGSNITGWGNGLNGSRQIGTWTVGADGIAVTGGGTIYKGDLMEAYEFSTHLYKTGIAENRMGIYAAAIDANNFLRAYFDLPADTFVVDGKQNGQHLSPQIINIPNQQDYNLRAVKLPDRVIFFVDGREVLSRSICFPASQTALFADNMSARFNGILAYRIEAETLPSSWKHTDVGSVGFKGSASYNEGTFTVNGSGSDIWLIQDGFHFVYQDLYGDGEIIARVVSNDITDWWNKAAVMIRDGLNSSAGMALVTLCGGGNLQFLWRTGPGVNAQGIDAPNPPYPQGVWLRLKRTGRQYDGYYSYNGSNWTLIGSRTLNFSSHLQIGLAVTAHHNNRLNGAVFDNVAIGGCTPGEYQTDLNRDCTIDISDLLVLAGQWLDTVSAGTSADLDGNLKITLGDYAILASDWLIDYRY